MLVRDFMTPNVITAHPQTSVADALTLMTEKRIRRLPVVGNGKLIGIVTWTDLMRASPFPRSPLAAAHGTRATADVTVGEVMMRDPTTVPPDLTIEEVAVLMRGHKIGGFPVVDGETLVGIITESDLFEAFIGVMGLHEGGTRLTIKQGEPAGGLRAIIDTLSAYDVGVLSLASYQMHGSRWIVVRVDAPYPLHVIQTLVECGINVTHLAPLPANSEEVKRSLDRRRGPATPRQ